MNRPLPSAAARTMERPETTLAKSAAPPSRLDGGDFKTLEPAGNYADNNYIHHIGVFFKQGVGVSVNGVGNRVSHNLIHDCPRFGIHWTGNDHLFEYNHIRHCTLETADTGADLFLPGRLGETRHDHSLQLPSRHRGFGQEHGKWSSPHMNWGIYLDDGHLRHPRLREHRRPHRPRRRPYSRRAR